MKKSELETEVYNLLKNSNLRVFKEDTRDPNYRGEYIEILPLEFGEERLFNSSIVNVNIHIPDVQGIKNSRRLDSAYNEIRPIFRRDKDATGQYYTNYSGFQFSIVSSKDYKEDNGTHVRNLRVKVTYLNL